MKNIEIDLKREYILAGDISISMSTEDPLCGNLSRYSYMLEKFKHFIKLACDIDPHGAPTVMLFGKEVYVYDHANITLIDEKLSNVKFEPLTMTDELLAMALRKHKEEKAEKADAKEFYNGTTLLIFTDGEPTLQASVERVLKEIENYVDRDDEFEIVFLTVGTVSPLLNFWLDKLKTTFPMVRVEELDKVEFIQAITKFN